MNTADCFATIERLFHDWHYDHPKILYGLIRSFRPTHVLEIGTYRGYAACYMARALQENNHGRLACIDNFSLNDHVARVGDPKTHLEYNLSEAGVLGFVDIIVGDTDKVKWPDQVDFAYIDGWHSYSACKSEFEKCSDLGAEVIALDDVTNCVGPRMFLEEVRRTKPEWDVLHIGRDNGLGVCVRRPQKTMICFSQELPNHPGVQLGHLSMKEVRDHFVDANKATGVDYTPLIKELTGS